MQNTKPNYERADSDKFHSRDCRQRPIQTIIRLFRTTTLTLALAAVAYALPARSQMVTFDAATNSYYTAVQCISPSGAVTGSYDVRDLAHHQFLQFGFIRNWNG